MKTEQEIVSAWEEIESPKDTIKKYSNDPSVNRANRQRRVKAFMDGLDEAESRFFNNWFCVKELVRVVESPKSSGGDKVKAIKMLVELWGILPEHKV